MYSDSLIISSAVKNRNLDIERALKLKKSLGIQSSAKIIGLVSALESHKDPITALKTIHELRKVRQDFAVLHFGNGVLFDQVSEAMKELNLDQIYFQMGHHENVEDYFSIMDVFLMTSKEEGLGSSVLDAFNYEVRVVSTNAGGLNDLVKDRGFLCDIGDTQCLSQGLSLALDSSKESIAHKIRAKEYCDNEMGVGLMANKYIDLYQGLINE
jgi:glycosyltransferase involved in cell wall biosynthesis